MVLSTLYGVGATRVNPCDCWDRGDRGSSQLILIQSTRLPGGVGVLGLTFGGGLATGLAIDGDQRGGPAAGQEGRSFPGPDGDCGFGDRDQPGPERGTPPQQRDDGDTDDDSVSPAPTPNS
jgi:hypothetical protein